MPDISFATGLLNGYFGKQAEERDRKEKNALAAAQFLMQSGRVRDYNDLLPILDQATGGTGTGSRGKKGGGGFKAGAKAGLGGDGDPHSILAQFINPILQAQSRSSSPAGGPSTGSAGPAAGPGGPDAPPVPQEGLVTRGTGGVPVSPGPTGPSGPPVPTGPGGSAVPPAPQTPQARGPLMSDDELDTRETARAVSKDEGLQTAKIARADRLATKFQAQVPGMTKQEALEAAYDAVGLKWPARKTDAAKTAGKPIPGASLPDDAKTVDNKPIPAEGREGFYQPVLVTGPDGPEVRYTPGASAGAGKTFTGQNDQIYQRVKNGHPDWSEEKIVAETVRQADMLDKLKQQSLVIRVENGQASDADVETLSDQLITGTLLPSALSRRSGNFNHLMAVASRKSMAQTGKPVDFTKMSLQYGAAQRFAATLNGSNIVRFRTLADSVVNTIDEVTRLGDELKQGGVQLWNKAKQSTIRQVYGNTPQSEIAVQYLSAINTLKEEFANLVNGGYAPTEPAFELANKQINGDYGVKDLTAALAETQRLINYRTGALNNLQALTPGMGGGIIPPTPAPGAPTGRGTQPGARPPNPFRVPAPAGR